MNACIRHLAAVLQLVQTYSRAHHVYAPRALSLTFSASILSGPAAEVFSDDKHSKLGHVATCVF